MKVLMLLHNLRVSAGVSSYVMNYFRAIDHDKIKMDFAIWKDVPTPYYEEIKAEGSTVYVLPSLKHYREHARYCRKIIAEGNYDIIHDNTLLVSYPLMRAAKRYGVPVRVLHSHSSRLGETKSTALRNQLLLPFLKSTATDYAACSTPAAQMMFGEREYSFIPNAISGERLCFSPERRDAVRAEMNAGSKVIVGTVGRIAAPKNPIFAVDVMEAAIQKNPNVEYWWIGSGAMDKALTQRVEKSRYKENIRLLGSREDVLDLYQAIDIFFLPSLFEGMPLTVLEAQAMGLPCVMSSTITREVVYTDLVHFVGLDEPVEQWVSVILGQTERISQRRSYREELKKSVFSMDNAGERLEEFYSALLTGKN